MTNACALCIVCQNADRRNCILSVDQWSKTWPVSRNAESGSEHSASTYGRNWLLPARTFPARAPNCRFAISPSQYLGVASNSGALVEHRIVRPGADKGAATAPAWAREGEEIIMPRSGFAGRVQLVPKAHKTLISLFVTMESGMVLRF